MRVARTDTVYHIGVLRPPGYHARLASALRVPVPQGVSQSPSHGRPTFCRPSPGNTSWRLSQHQRVPVRPKEVPSQFPVDGGKPRRESRLAAAVPAQRGPGGLAWL